MARKCDFGVLPFNWRDVGVALHSLGAAGFLPAGRILRCGLVDQQHWEDIGKPLTIINLRPEADIGPLEMPSTVKLCHQPIDDNVDHIAYNTTDPRTVLWVRSVLECVQNAVPPILIHCRSGKDRTGVIVGALLMLLHNEHGACLQLETIMREYALTTSDLKTESFMEALAGLHMQKGWHEGLDTDKLRQVLCKSPHPPSVGMLEGRYVHQEEVHFLSETVKHLLAKSNPVNIMQEFRMQSNIACIEDSDERLRLCGALLPIAEKLIALNISDKRGYLAKAAALEHVAYAELCNTTGQQSGAAEQLRAAAGSWAALSSLGKVGPVAAKSEPTDPDAGELEQRKPDQGQAAEPIESNTIPVPSMPKWFLKLCKEHHDSCIGAIAAEDDT
mmetsp:Transcript_69325/g.137013  ORF Transcript_69325/g.137013 Transcript_69325/m.137013 type:complete len:388 (+) Transcript_69325:18-1181(+)